MARLCGPSDSFDKKRCEENPRHRRRRKREALVYAHLEHVSRDLLESHPDVVRDFIGRNAGVYALYKKVDYITWASQLPCEVGSRRTAKIVTARDGTVSQSI